MKAVLHYGASPGFRASLAGLADGLDIVVVDEESPDFAREIAECARLIKGYGDTHARGLTNYRAIEARVIRPALAGAMPLGRATDAVGSARIAALIDPEGESLARCLGEIEIQEPLPIAAE